MRTFFKQKIIIAACVALAAILAVAGFFAYTFARRDHFLGEGTAESPYLIASKTDFDNLAYYTNQYNQTNNGYAGKHFRLTADIDYKGKSFNKIGSGSVNSFRGHFDGDGHTLKNISAQKDSRQDGAASGIFGVLGDGARVERLRVENFHFVIGSQRTHSGALAERISEGAIVSDCHTEVRVERLVDAKYGGISGGNSGRIEFSSAKILIAGVPGSVGGIATENYGEIVECFAEVLFARADAVTGSESNQMREHYNNTAGIVFSNNGRVQNCVATGTIEIGQAGGIVGAIMGYGWDGVTEGCISAVRTTGGFAAVGDGTVTNSYCVKAEGEDCARGCQPVTELQLATADFIQTAAPRTGAWFYEYGKAPWLKDSFSDAAIATG